MKQDLKLNVQVTGSNPKDYQLEVVCNKGTLAFDFEFQKLVMPADFQDYCRARGAIWAIFLEAEIKFAIKKYLSK